MVAQFGFQDVFGQHCRPVGFSADGFFLMEFLSGKIEERDPLELHVALSPVKKVVMDN
jgi:hypothetical protein